MMRKIFMCLLLAALCAGCAGYAGLAAAAPQGDGETEFMRQHPGLIEKFEAEARRVMDAGGIPGMAIALTDDRGILWAEGFGYTDASRSRPVDANTIFSIQSISKTVTATAVVEAANRGLLDLDRPITDYLPDFTVNSVFEEHPERQMTLKHLLSHTAGFTHEAPVGNNDDADARSFEDHIRSISDTWLRAPVGRDYAYSNLGIDLAGYILQKVSGQPFQSYVDQSLTDPAGMADSTFDMHGIKANPNRARGSNSAYSQVPLEIPMIPAGGFYTSANDMAKFIRHHLNNTAALQEMYQIPYPVNGQTEGYALGVTRYSRHNTYYLNHNGGGFGFLAGLTWYPELKLGIIVLTNSADSPAGSMDPFDLGMEILDGVIADGSTVYHQRQAQFPRPRKPPVSDLTLQPKLISDVLQGLNAVKGKPMPDESRYKGYAGVYTATAKDMPFFCGVARVTVQYGRLYKDGDALTETQKGLFFDSFGEALDLRGDTKTFRSIRIEKLPLGMAFVMVLPPAFFALFLASIVLLACRRKKRRSVTPGGAARAAGIVLGVGAGLGLLFIASFGAILPYYLSLLNNESPGMQTFRLLASAILAMKVLSPLVLLSAAAAAAFCVIAWVKKWWPRLDRIGCTCFAALCIWFVLFLFRMNLIIF
jgi:CubicO group peptidase (beta-lactamase class C family)